MLHSSAAWYALSRMKSAHDVLRPSRRLMSAAWRACILATRRFDLSALIARRLSERDIFICECLILRAEWCTARCAEFLLDPGWRGGESRGFPSSIAS